MKYRSIICTIILISVLSITVGFSAFVSEMSISNIVADVRVEKDVRITGVRFAEDESTEVVVNNLDFDADSIISNVTSTSSYSELIYYVTITNFGNTKVSVYNAYSTNGYIGDQSWWYGIPICDASKCTLGVSTEIRVSVYELSGTSEVDITFDIRDFYGISYKNIYNSSSLPSEMLYGDEYNYYLGENYPHRVNIYSDGVLLPSSDYYYGDGYLAGLEVEGDILIEGVYEYAYHYIGDPQTFVAPMSGTYKIELWGAQGGYEVCDPDVYPGSYGGYTKGDIYLNKGTTLYVYVGENPIGKVYSGGYNGGGNSNYDGSGGGGATDIRLDNSGVLNFDSLKSRIMVAAGGGGGYDLTDHGGGGLIGYKRIYENDGGGGTQTAGGAGGDSTVYNVTCVYNMSPGSPANGLSQNGSFGKGGDANYLGTGGGGGYYGGGSGTYMCMADGGGAGGGGSSFISGHTGCDAISAASTSSNIVHTGQSVHYSGYKFTNTVIIDSVGYNWTTSKGSYVGMPTHDGTGTMVGNAGGGYAKITLLEAN